MGAVLIQPHSLARVHTDRPSAAAIEVVGTVREVAVLRSPHQWDTEIVRFQAPPDALADRLNSCLFHLYFCMKIYLVAEKHAHVLP